MDSWTWTETKHRTQQVGYENVVGTPAVVEAKVKALVGEGWETNGPLMPYTPDGKLCGLYVQSVVKYITVKHGKVRE